jgi:hypothetical protein
MTDAKHDDGSTSAKVLAVLEQEVQTISSKLNQVQESLTSDMKAMEKALNDGLKAVIEKDPRPSTGRKRKATRRDTATAKKIRSAKFTPDTSKATDDPVTRGADCVHCVVLRRSILVCSLVGRTADERARSGARIEGSCAAGERSENCQEYVHLRGIDCVRLIVRVCLSSIRTDRHKSTRKASKETKKLEAEEQFKGHGSVDAQVSRQNTYFSQTCKVIEKHPSDKDPKLTDIIATLQRPACRPKILNVNGKDKKYTVRWPNFLSAEFVAAVNKVRAKMSKAVGRFEYGGAVRCGASARFPFAMRHVGRRESAGTKKGRPLQWKTLKLKAFRRGAS